MFLKTRFIMRTNNRDASFILKNNVITLANDKENRGKTRGSEVM